MKGEKMCTDYLIAPAQRMATQRRMLCPGPTLQFSGKIKIEIYT